MELTNAMFDEMSMNEMEGIDGGNPAIAGFLLGILIDAAVTSTTGKSIGGWIQYGVEKAAATIF